MKLVGLDYFVSTVNLLFSYALGRASSEFLVGISALDLKSSVIGFEWWTLFNICCFEKSWLPLIGDVGF